MTPASSSSYLLLSLLPCTGKLLKRVVNISLPPLPSPPDPYKSRGQATYPESELSRFPAASCKSNDDFPVLILLSISAISDKADHASFLKSSVLLASGISCSPLSSLAAFLSFLRWAPSSIWPFSVGEPHAQSSDPSLCSLFRQSHFTSGGGKVFFLYPLRFSFWGPAN